MQCKEVCCLTATTGTRHGIGIVLERFWRALGRDIAIGRCEVVKVEWMGNIMKHLVQPDMAPRNNPSLYGTITVITINDGNKRRLAFDYPTQISKSNQPRCRCQIWWTNADTVDNEKHARQHPPCSRRV